MFVTFPWMTFLLSMALAGPTEERKPDQPRPPNASVPSVGGGISTAAPSDVESCEEFDLREPGGSMHDVPTHDQGNVGDCYANAAASAVDAWLHSNTPESDPRHNLITSPTIAAIYTKQSIDERSKSVRTVDTKLRGSPEGSLLSTDSLSRPWEGIRNYGICPHKSIEQRLQDSSLKQDRSMFVGLLTNIYSTYHDQLIKAMAIVDDQKRAAEEKLVIKRAKEAYQSALQLGNFQNMTNVFMDETIVSSILRKETVDDGNGAAVGRLCPPFDHFSMPSDFPKQTNTFNVGRITNESFLKSNAARSQIINNVINAMLHFEKPKQQPIAIIYCAGVLFSPQYSGVQTGTPSCAQHASLIVARKNENGCVFVIRNSWGTRDISEGKGMDPEFMDTNGDVHVPVASLLRNTLLLSFLAPSGAVYTPPRNIYAGAREALEAELREKGMTAPTSSIPLIPVTPLTPPRSVQSLSTASNGELLVGGKKISFVFVPSQEAMISSNCVRNGRLSSCDASRALGQVPRATLSPKGGGANPGARLCSEKLNGAVAWSRDPKGNEKTFCKFNDGTYLSTHTLWVHGKKAIMR